MAETRKERGSLLSSMGPPAGPLTLEEPPFADFYFNNSILHVKGNFLAFRTCLNFSDRTNNRVITVIQNADQMSQR